LIKIDHHDYYVIVLIDGMSNRTTNNELGFISHKVLLWFRSFEL